MNKHFILLAVFGLISCSSKNNQQPPQVTLNTTTSSSPQPSKPAYDFQSEVEAVNKLLDTHGSITPGEEGIGALYGVILGSAQTVKVFINESPSTKSVENIKIMWNDWTSNAGYGVHSDKSMSIKTLEKMLPRYAPKDKAHIYKTFLGKTNKSWVTVKYNIEYTYYQGPKIGEHLLTITPK